MPTVYDVPVDRLVKRLAKYLKENVSEITPPTWAMFVKTSSHKEKPPQNLEWWYTRCASILRKIYIEGPIGVSRLRTFYGGKKKHTDRPEHYRKGGGAIVRKTLQQLEKAGFIKTAEKKGRVITKEGKSLLDRLAGEVKRDLEKEIPSLKKF